MQSYDTLPAFAEAFLTQAAPAGQFGDNAFTFEGVQMWRGKIGDAPLARLYPGGLVVTSEKRGDLTLAQLTQLDELLAAFVLSSSTVNLGQTQKLTRVVRVEDLSWFFNPVAQLGLISVEDETERLANIAKLGIALTGDDLAALSTYTDIRRRVKELLALPLGEVPDTSVGWLERLWPDSLAPAGGYTASDRRVIVQEWIDTGRRRDAFGYAVSYHDKSAPFQDRLAVGNILRLRMTSDGKLRGIVASGGYVTRGDGARQIAEEAFKVWAGDKTGKTYLEVTTSSGVNSVSITKDRVSIGCQTIAKQEIVRVAHALGWAVNGRWTGGGSEVADSSRLSVRES